MTTNQLMTWGAIGFAAFALAYITRRPQSGAIGNQPGQQQRDAALADWNAMQAGQWVELQRQQAQERFRSLERMVNP